MKTGDKRNGGTDAQVFIELYGEKTKKSEGGSSGRIQLEGGEFERNSVDQFKLQIAGLFSPMSHILIGHNNEGLGAGWYLGEVRSHFTPTRSNFARA